MKLPDVGYRRAECMEHAVQLLAEHGPDARVLAGGQSLVPVMALRMSHPSVLVDITRCPDLSTWSWQDDTLVISAAVTARRVERDSALAQRFPLVGTALSHVGHPEIRNRGTVCGSAAHADPAAEVPALLLATGGSVRVIGPEGRRRVPATDFFEGPYMSSLAPGELVAGVELTGPTATAGWSVLEIARRHGDFALVGVVCVLDVDPATRRCTSASLALFGCASTATRRLAAEASLVGQELTPDVLDRSAELAFADLEVLGDVHGSVGYRTDAGTVLVRRALGQAAARTSSDAGSRS